MIFSSWSNFSVVEKRLLAFVIFAMFLVSGTACGSISVKTESESIGTRFHPGHYVMTSISRSHPPAERSLKRIKFIKHHLADPEIRGFMSHFEWKVLEPERDQYNLKPIGDILRVLEGSDKYLAIYLRDRNFGKECTKPPVPKYLLGKEFGKPYKHNVTCMIELYNPDVVNRKLALYKAIADKFDRHPNLELITDGETSIGGSIGYSHDAWVEEIKRFYIEAKKSFRHTMVLVQLNFLGGSDHYLYEVARVIEETGGGAIGLPDTVPCRRRDIPASEVCDYTIPGYDVLRKFHGRIAIAPNAETWDLQYEESSDVYDMALNYLGADHVFWSRSFTSRRDKSNREPDAYINEQVLPMLQRLGSKIEAKCPTSLIPCISR